MRLFLTPAWGRWRCDGCGSVLGISVRRRVLATIPWVGILFVLIGVLRITRLGYAIAIPMLLAAGILNYFLFDRPVLHERTGFRCRRCGYDLQGQVEGRCPECGTEFELAELAAHRASGRRKLPAVSRARTWIALAVALILGLFLATVVVIHFRGVRTRVPRRRPIAAPQSAPASQPATDEPATTAPAGSGGAATRPEEP